MANWPSLDRKSTRLNSSHTVISYAVFCLKKKNVNMSEHPASKDNMKLMSQRVVHIIWRCTGELVCRMGCAGRMAEQSFFFFNDTATTEIYTLSLHDALPILFRKHGRQYFYKPGRHSNTHRIGRSEEHTSELQSHSDLVCRLLLEKKKKK